MVAIAKRKAFRRRYKKLKANGLCPICMGERINKNYICCENCRKGID